jgi:hypothetical protein
VIYTKKPVEFTAIQCVHIEGSQVEFNVAKVKLPNWIDLSSIFSVCTDYGPNYISLYYKNNVHYHIYELDWIVHNPETDNIEILKNDEFLNKYSKIS